MVDVKDRSDERLLEQYIFGSKRSDMQEIGNELIERGYECMRFYDACRYLMIEATKKKRKKQKKLKDICAEFLDFEMQTADGKKTGNIIIDVATVKKILRGIYYE